jgi:C1A family cysteine protease
MGTRYALGLIRDSHDDQDFRFSRIANAAGLWELPPAVDLRPQASPVRDQQSLGACTGFGIACGFLELLLARADRATSLSPLFVYWFERRLEHAVNQDAGAMIRDGMKVLRGRGAAPERDWPYDVARFRDTPLPEARHHARDYQIASYHRVNGLLEMKRALAMGLPVPFGVDVFDSFMGDDAARTGVIPLPNVEVEELQGGHCLCGMGYLDREHLVIAKNAWGTTWGRDGYALIPYEFFNPRRRLVSDAWTGLLQ